MAYEAGSRECRTLIEAKENLIQIMQSLRTIKDLDHIQSQLREIYNELEQMHEDRRKIENQ